MRTRTALGILLVASLAMACSSGSRRTGFGSSDASGSDGTDGTTSADTSGDLDAGITGQEDSGTTDGADVFEPSDVPTPDVGLPDVAVSDTNAPDSVTPTPDTSVPDASIPDTGVPDTSTPDVTVPDVGEPDTSTPDAGTCTPDCTSAVCGGDGCGGSCGTCSEGQFCASGACEAYGDTPATCADAHGLVGCCANNGVFWFENGLLQGGNNSCGDQECGWDAANGYYACGFEGAEPTGQYPLACFGENPDPGSCAACSCTDKMCGDDGCGTSCGTCSEGMKCASGQCIEAGALVCLLKEGCTEDNPCDCTTCETDSTCTTADDCVCSDCASDSYCSNADNCTDDGVCDAYNEGCICADCQQHPSCLAQ